MSRQQHLYLKEEHLRSKENFDKFLKIYEANEKISQDKFKELMEKQKTLIDNLNQQIDKFMAKSPPLSCLKKEQKQKICLNERPPQKRIARFNISIVDEIIAKDKKQEKNTDDGALTQKRTRPEILSSRASKRPLMG